MLSVLLASVALLAGQAAGQGACSNGCVWSCDNTRGQCADPTGKRVCINVTDLRKRSQPGTGSDSTITGAWNMGDQGTISNGPVQKDGFAWFQFDSGAWSAFSSTNGVFWFTTCPGTPPFVPPTPRPTPPPTPPPTPRPTPMPVPGATPSPVAATPAPSPSASQSAPSPAPSTAPVVGEQCNPQFDKCCTPEGLIAPAGTVCFVKSAQCVLEMSACDGRAFNCPVVPSPNGQQCTTTSGQAGACTNGICQAMTKSCAPGVMASVTQCSQACAKMSKSMKELCFCKQQTSCWNAARLSQFVSGQGTDVAQFTDSCPDFCVCSCGNGGDAPPASAASLARLSAAVLSLAVLAL